MAAILRISEQPCLGCFSHNPRSASCCSRRTGLAVLPCLFGDEDDALVRAGTCPPTKSCDIWLLTHNDLRRTARVQAFMKFAEGVLRDRRRTSSCGSSDCLRPRGIRHFVLHRHSVHPHLGFYLWLAWVALSSSPVPFGCDDIGQTALVASA